jgi:outer membrane lipoprotein SlyB
MKKRGTNKSLWISAVLLSLWLPVSGQVVQRIKYGTVVSTREVTVDTGTSGVGAVVGSTTGAVAGHAIARAGGGWFGGLLGGVLGGVAGNAIEKAASKKKGIELVIRFENGDEVGIQLPGESTFKKGDRVRLMTGPNGRTQVTAAEG